jgi:hypothetical protein
MQNLADNLMGDYLDVLRLIAVENLDRVNRITPASQAVIEDRLSATLQTLHFP